MAGSVRPPAGPVTTVLGPWLAGPVEHIGSTSVPGLPAKPVIDILAPVRSLAAAQDSVSALAADGWLFWSEDPCRHYRLWFLRPRPPPSRDRLPDPASAVRGHTRVIADADLQVTGSAVFEVGSPGSKV